MNTKTLNIKSQNLKTLCVDPAPGDSKIQDVDLECPNLENLSLGIETYLQDVDFLKNLNLKNLSFGEPYQKTTYNDMLLTFEEKEKSIGVLDSNLNNSYYGTFGVTFIDDLNGLKGSSSLEALCIAPINRVNSDEFFDIVKSLPNLKEIRGLASNNAMLYSDELISYCEQNNISHPFNEKSKEIKNEITRIANEITTPEMSDIEKIKSITKYVVEHMEYDFETSYKDTSGEDAIKKTWGEKLYYSLRDGYGVCDGYEALTHALLQAANVNAYRQNNTAHTWELVQIGDNYYQLDTTKLDYLLDQTKTQNIEASEKEYIKQFIKDHPNGYDIINDNDPAPFLLVTPESPSYQDAYISPEDIKAFRKNKISEFCNSITTGILDYMACIKPIYFITDSKVPVPHFNSRKFLNKILKTRSVDDLSVLKTPALKPKSKEFDRRKIKI